MTEGVDDRFSKGFRGNLGNVYPQQSIQSHTDVDMLQDVFFGSVDQGEYITGKILHIQSYGCICRPEYGTAQPGVGKELLRFAGKAEHGSIQQFAVSNQIQLIKGVGDRVEREPAEFQEGFQLTGTDIIYRRLAANLRIPTQPVTVFCQNKVFQFTGTYLPIFIADPYICPAIGVVGVLLAFDQHLDALFGVSRYLLDNRIYFGLNMIGNRLGDVSNSFIRNLLADDRAIVPDTEPHFAPLMFVQHGNNGDYRLL